MHVLVSLAAADEEPWIPLFRAALPEARVERRDPAQPAEPAAAQADYLVAAMPSATLFAEQRAAKAVFTASAGVGHVLRDAQRPREVPLIRVEDAGMAPQMIRYVLAAALRVCGGGDRYARQQREGRWEQHPARDPSAVTVGVLGLGVIGAAIARALAAHGFAVRGYARRPREVAGVRCFAGTHELGPFLDGLDLVVNVLPATPATAGILDRAALARLADGAHVVNIGRGQALVDDDLLALLDAGKLAGATLDVFGEEPLPPAHPFWRRPEITMTPHVAGLTVPAATVAQIAAKIRRLERGEAVTGIVDAALGY